MKKIILVVCMLMLLKDNKYYFPIIVSGREVAVAEIIKTGDTHIRFIALRKKCFH